MADMARNGVCEALTATLRERVNWDEEPALYCMYQEPASVRLAQAIPEGGWPSGQPAQVLAFLASEVSRIRPDIFALTTSPNFLGMAFRCETWLTTASAGAGASLGEQTRAALNKGPRPSLHPNRVETRFMWAVTRSGIHYVAIQKRGEKNILARKPEASDGTVADALAQIVRAVTIGAN